MPDLILASSVTIEVTGPAPVVWEQVEPSPVTVGDKLWVKQLDSSGSVAWLYSLTNSGTVLHRLMLI